MSKIKLLVEIDEYCRDAIIRHINGTYGAQLPYYIISSAFKAIANGTPYNPSGDCISREAINSEIEKRYCSKHCVVPSEEPYCPDNCPARFLKNIVKECPTVDLWQMRQEATENALKKAEVLYGNPKDRWISVKEKLPELHNSVVATDNNDVFVAWYDEGWKSSDSQFDKHTPIVAWRPIPQYTESEKGGADNEKTDK